MINKHIKQNDVYLYNIGGHAHVAKKENIIIYGTFLSNKSSLSRKEKNDYFKKYFEKYKNDILKIINDNEEDNYKFSKIEITKGSSATTMIIFEK